MARQEKLDALHEQWQQEFKEQEKQAMVKSLCQWLGYGGMNKTETLEILHRVEEAVISDTSALLIADRATRLYQQTVKCAAGDRCIEVKFRALRDAEVLGSVLGKDQKEVMRDIDRYHDALKRK